MKSSQCPPCYQVPPILAFFCLHWGRSLLHIQILKLAGSRNTNALLFYAVRQTSRPQSSHSSTFDSRAFLSTSSMVKTENEFLLLRMTTTLIECHITMYTRGQCGVVNPKCTRNCTKIFLIWKDVKKVFIHVNVMSQHHSNTLLFGNQTVSGSVSGHVRPQRMSVCCWALGGRHVFVYT